MRFATWLLAAWLAFSPALADSSFVAPTANGTAPVGQLPGTTTNDNATAGNIGEYVSAGSLTGNATVTITIAAPAVVTWTAHGIEVPATAIQTATPVSFTTTGALPTGLVASTIYYAVPVDANTFRVSTTFANAMSGTYITTTGSQSGVQTGSFTVSLTSAQIVDATAIGLTAGDWDIMCEPGFVAGASTTATNFVSSISTTAVTRDQSKGRWTSFLLGAAVIGATEFFNVPAGPARFSLSATTTVYCNAYSTFGVSTMVIRSFMRARRER